MDNIPPHFPEGNGEIFRRNGATNEDDADDEDFSPCKGLIGRRRKGAHEYATQYQDDFTSQTILQQGMRVSILVCKFCAVMIGTRSDRIKEHLSSKRHIKLRSEAEKVVHEQYSSSGDGINQNQPSNINGRSGRMAPSTYIPPRSSTSSEEKSASQGFGVTRDDDVSINLNMSMEEVNVLWPATSAALNNMASMRDNVIDNPSSINVNVDKRRTAMNGSSPPDQLLAPGGPSSSSSQSKPTSYKLTWNAQGNIFRNAFIMFQEAGLLTDVTLSSGIENIKCHKVVLSACSEYFASLFKQHPPLRPIFLVLKPGVISQLKALVHFMYHGEITVPKVELKPLLKLAKELGISGLILPRGVRKQADAIHTGKDNKDGFRQAEISTRNRWHPGHVTCAAPVNAKLTHQQGSSSCVPGLFPIGSPFSAMDIPGQGQCNSVTNGNSELNRANGGWNGPVITSTSSLLTSTSLLNGSGPSSSITDNISLVNDRTSMMPVTDVGNYLPLPPRKRKFQSKGPVTTFEMLRHKKSEMVLEDAIDPSNYGHQLPSMLNMNMAGGFQFPSNGNGITSSPGRNMEGLNIAAGQIDNGDGGRQASNVNDNPRCYPASKSKANTTVVFGQRGEQYFVIGSNSNPNNDAAGHSSSRESNNTFSFPGGML